MLFLRDCLRCQGSFGELQEATGEGMDEFFSRADADQSGKVSFAELVAVFVVEEQRSPALKNCKYTHGIHRRLRFLDGSLRDGL